MHITLQHFVLTQTQPSPQRDIQSSSVFPSRTIVHAKLEMTEPGDHDEQEADAVANTIATGGKISRKISGGGSGTSGINVSNQMESQLNHLRGGGQAMPTGLRNMMESGFGQDFSHVRLHTDSEAATLSSSIHAKAFTHGNDIYFNQGQFSPNTSEGQKLMAHELTHVMQGGGRLGRCTDKINTDNVELKYDGLKLSIIERGKTVSTYNAWSGMGKKNEYGYTCFSYDEIAQQANNEGPAPEGDYIIHVDNIHDFVSFFDNPKARMFRWAGGEQSWGKQRVEIEPKFKTNRTGLNIHGGHKPGSRGCIDLTHNEELFFSDLKKILQKYNQSSVILHIKYNDDYKRGKLCMILPDDDKYWMLNYEVEKNRQKRNDR